MSYLDSGFTLGGSASISNRLLGGILLVYGLIAPRYMRGKLLQNENSISALLPNGEREFHSLFGKVSAIGPTLILFVLFSVLVFITSLTGPFVLRLSDLSYAAVLSLGLASILWPYYTSSSGIHSMGAVKLNLRPYFADPHLGLRPVGSLALSLAAAYFAGIGLGTLNAISYGTDVYGYLALGILILLGILFFFLPLLRLHQRMLLQKRLERSKVGEKLGEIFQNDDKENVPVELSRMFRLEMMERKISVVATWPFDVQILSRLVVIVLSVTTVLLARVVAYYLKIVVPLG
jgi:hypothetical protein